MEQPVSLQLLQLGAAVLTGAALGVLYDLLRVLRRRGRHTALFDGVFCLALLCTLLLFAFYPGRGELRIFMLIGIGAGAALYFLMVSPLTVRLFDGILRLLLWPWRQFLRFFRFVLQKIKESTRKTVAFVKKSVKIEKKKRGKRRTPKKGGGQMKLKKTSLLTKLLILVVSGFALVSLVTVQAQLIEKRKEIALLEEQVMYEEQAQKELEEDIKNFGSDESIIKIARERLGMVADGEIVFYDSDN